VETQELVFSVIVWGEQQKVINACGIISCWP